MYFICVFYDTINNLEQKVLQSNTTQSWLFVTEPRILSSNIPRSLPFKFITIYYQLSPVSCTRCCLWDWEYGKINRNKKKGYREIHTCLDIVFKASTSRILSDKFTAHCLTLTKQKQVYYMLIRKLQVPRWSGNYRAVNAMENFS